MANYNMYVSTLKVCRVANIPCFVLYIIYIMFIKQAEARVFCQDSHAKPWQPLGHSCPINCGNVMTAVKKLKSLDYSRLFSHQTMQFDTKVNKHYEISPNKMYTENETTENRNIYDHNPKINIYRRYHKILNNEMVLQDLKMESMTSVDSMKACYSQNEFKHWKLNNKCSRSNIEIDFLKKFTSILNRYTKSIPFTEELTAMILEKVLGKNLDLRHGLFDVKKILLFLSTAIHNHETNRIQRGPVINLKSKHCLPLKVMGCFCLAGFVEKSGQCVMPSDCFDEMIEKDLLARIIVY